jgi:protein-S-isoprenylcysteine O-methyltransferase Ste14
VLQLVLVGLVAAAGVLLGPDWHGWAALASGVIGVLLIVAGLLLGAWAVLDLGQSVSPLPRPKNERPLVVDGAYRHLRHPVYAGLIMSAVGWGLLTTSIVALVASLALIVLLDLKARREEAWLREHYAGYAEYARRVRRFVPGIY